MKRSFGNGRASEHGSTTIATVCVCSGGALDGFPGEGLGAGVAVVAGGLIDPEDGATAGAEHAAHVAAGALGAAQGAGGAVLLKVALLGLGRGACQPQDAEQGQSNPYTAVRRQRVEKLVRKHCFGSVRGAGGSARGALNRNA